MAQTNAYTCALRALNLCDGQVLEEPDNALTKCLCEELRRMELLAGPHPLSNLCKKRQKLIERTMAD